ncbi:TPA: toll/interleukin-1 receptor domain-containing protein [Vibrio cholerae]|nr:toll/interleukin-1 receptor domain-containing protein [Vibrio cholerae]HCJ7281299.1 toll/interleukin-1 receptor domain-containing protein [Vibrio cholerae]HCJ7319063.1 toll/interleukin-1 receptor domain-containing protein [Vibrio cholerae]
MKVFISWSGAASHQVAKVFRDWLPSVIQSVKPYVSSEDIDKGSRWSTDIAGELEESTYGILCVTRENLEAPWLNFEAGALGKSIDKSRVSPFLHKLKRSEVKGPILQFQSTIQEKEDLFKLVKSINLACGESGLDESRLEKVFNVWWPDLEKQLCAIETHEEASAIPNDSLESTSEIDGISEILEEILEISRANQRLLRSPEEILPQRYLEHVIGDKLRINQKHFFEEESVNIHPQAVNDAIYSYRDLLSFIREISNDLPGSPFVDELYNLIKRMDDPIRYMSKQLGKRLPRLADNRIRINDELKF